jgi:putative membrane protein
LGLFILVINGVLFYMVGHWLQGFEVRTLMAGIIGAIVYSVFSWLLTAILIEDK